MTHYNSSYRYHSFHGGVYTSSPITSSAAFLFSLTDGEGREPVKIPISHGHSAISYDESTGPIFGSREDPDLRVCSHPNTRDSSSSSLGNAYATPPGADGATVLAGASSFCVSEMEVFELNEDEEEEDD